MEWWEELQTRIRKICAHIQVLFPTGWHWATFFNFGQFLHSKDGDQYLHNIPHRNILKSQKKPQLGDVKHLKLKESIVFN